MARKIDISFKNNTKENNMYEYFSSLEDRSGDIKNILYEWYKKNVISKSTTANDESDGTANKILNF